APPAGGAGRTDAPENGRAPRSARAATCGAAHDAAGRAGQNGGGREGGRVVGGGAGGGGGPARRGRSGRGPGARGGRRRPGGVATWRPRDWGLQGATVQEAYARARRRVTGPKRRF